MLSLELSCSACGSFRLRQTNQKLNSCERHMHIALSFLHLSGCVLLHIKLLGKCNIPLTWKDKLDYWVECVIATCGHFISYISVANI